MLAKCYAKLVTASPFRVKRLFGPVLAHRGHLGVVGGVEYQETGEERAAAGQSG